MKKLFIFVFCLIFLTGCKEVNSNIFSDEYSRDYDVLVDNSLLNRIANELKSDSEFKFITPLGTDVVLAHNDENLKEYTALSTTIKEDSSRNFKVYLLLRYFSEDGNFIDDPLSEEKLPKFLKLLLPDINQDEIEKESHRIIEVLKNTDKRAVDFHVGGLHLEFKPNYYNGYDGKDIYGHRVIVDITQYVPNVFSSNLLNETEKNFNRLYSDNSLEDFSNENINNNVPVISTKFFDNVYYYPITVRGQIIGRNFYPPYDTLYRIEVSPGVYVTISNKPDNAMFQNGDVVEFSGVELKFKGSNEIIISTDRSKQIQ